MRPTIDRHPKVVEAVAQVAHAKRAIDDIDAREKVVRAQIKNPSNALSDGHRDALRQMLRNELAAIPARREKAKENLRLMKLQEANFREQAREQISRMLQFDSTPHDIDISHDPEWQARCERRNHLGAEVAALNAKICAPAPQQANLCAAAASVASGATALSDLHFEAPDRTAEIGEANMRREAGRRALEEMQNGEHIARARASERLAEKHGLAKTYEAIIGRMVVALKAASQAVAEETLFRDALQSGGLSVESVVPACPWPAPGLGDPATNQHDILHTWLADVRKAFPSIKGT